MSVTTCKDCGWNAATSDGRCLDCAAPPEPEDFGGSAWCDECGAAVGEESLTDGYCWSCGERL